MTIDPATGRSIAVKAGASEGDATAVAGSPFTTEAVITEAVKDYAWFHSEADIIVTGVTLDNTALELVVDESATLTATVAPDDATNPAVRWSSDNTAVATVDNNGTVTAVGPGTATPTPTAAPPERHTLHFNTMGGLPLDDVAFGLGAPVELWPYTPVRPGYRFVGWYADEALTKAVSTLVLAEDTTLYAKWAEDPSAAPGSAIPQTGDGSAPALWAALFGLSALALGALVLRKRKNKPTA